MEENAELQVIHRLDFFNVSPETADSPCRREHPFTQPRFFNSNFFAHFNSICGHCVCVFSGHGPKNEIAYVCDRLGAVLSGARVHDLGEFRFVESLGKS